MLFGCAAFSFLVSAPRDRVEVRVRLVLLEVTDRGVLREGVKFQVGWHRSTAQPYLVEERVVVTFS
jgi:hypothetical protein